MNLGGQLRRRVFWMVIAPAWIALIALNTLAWLARERYRDGELDVVQLRAQHAIEGTLAAESARLMAASRWPAIKTLLGTPLEMGSDPMLVSRAWAQLTREEVAARRLLDVGVGEQFRQTWPTPVPGSLWFLTDRQGIVRAASNKTPLYDHRQEAWWLNAANRPDDAPTATPPDRDGLLGLTLPLREGAELLGVLRAEHKADVWLAPPVDRPPPPAAILLVSSASARSLAGDRPPDEALAALLAGCATGEETAAGVSAGFRFRARRLDAGLHWDKPLWAAALRKEARLPYTLLDPLLAAGLLSLALGIAWTVLCRRSFGRLFGKGHQDRLEAGDWSLNKAFGHPWLLKRPPGPDGSPALTSTQQDLDNWLQDLVQDLQQKQESQSIELQRDLDLARDFQRAYMDRPYPEVPAVHIPGHLRLSFAHRYQPASILGGDFYSVLPLASDCAGVVVADVMGHGTRSALITAILRTLIDDLAPQGRNARHFATELNKQFCELLRNIPEPQFASAFYFVADTTSRVATFSSAGHPAPFHLQRGSGKITRLDVPMPRGAALGALPAEQYTAGYCRLNDGDFFVFFTDGLYEAHNTEGDEFGIVQMEKVLQKLMYKPPAAMVEGLMEAVLAFAGKEPIADDICLVVVEVSDKAAAPAER